MDDKESAKRFGGLCGGDAMTKAETASPTYWAVTSSSVPVGHGTLKSDGGQIRKMALPGGRAKRHRFTKF